MSYDLYDFKESLRITGYDPQRIESVRWGFGESPEGGGSWEGGFVFRYKCDKPVELIWAFVYGWCDYTGWGCQDGAWAVQYTHMPTFEQLSRAWKKNLAHDVMPMRQWDYMPADLNRWVKGEVNEWGEKIEPPKAKYLGEPIP